MADMEAERDRYREALIALAPLAAEGVAPEVMRQKMAGVIREALGGVPKEQVEVERLRTLLSEAEGWCEEIQHAGYAVPHGQGGKFLDFWEKLQDEVG